GNTAIGLPPQQRRTQHRPRYPPRQPPAQRPHRCRHQESGSKGLPFKVLLLCDLDEEAAQLRREIASCGFNSPS
ncbi:hypothetical protein, partial [Rugosimonospora africana]|uniref:hypothetical protein n=1 Tax=Rugosimonospora africana TaxID=556532 RepID=UPI0019448419